MRGRVPSSHVALLRAINVGGNNLIRMTALRAVIGNLGFRDVSTYIASGNVIFSGSGSGKALETKIEAELSRAFRYDSRVVVRSFPQMRQVIGEAPKGWPRPEYRCNVIFLKSSLSPKTALAAMPPKPGVDDVSHGPGVLYVATRMDRRTRSGLSKFMGTPPYKLTTIRTYGTCSKILELMEA